MVHVQGFLTGNLVHKGREYKLEPVITDLDRREFSSHLGTPHSMEAIPLEYRIGGIKEHKLGGKISLKDLRLPLQLQRILVRHENSWRRRKDLPTPSSWRNYWRNFPNRNDRHVSLMVLGCYWLLIM